MKSMDLTDQTLLDLRQKLQNAMSGGDQDAYMEALEANCQHYGNQVLAEYEELRDETDVAILASRGVRQLTSVEQQYYRKLGAAMKDKDPRQAVNNLDVVMPETVIDSIFEDLRTNHPLLSRINFMNTNGAIRMMMNTNGYQRAAWGSLCAEIVQELTSGFREVKTDLNKLSAFIPICKAMLDLGPAWLDRYTRMVLSEGLSNGMEYGLVNGTGKDEPIGMTKQVGDNVTTTGGVYPDKTSITVTDFSPVTMGNLISIMAAGPKGNARAVNDVILVVNPQDYFQRIMPATTIMGPDGLYRNDVFPYPMSVIQSAALPRGKAVLGIARLYWAFAGMSKDGRIEYSDDYRFLEDERVYLIKTYANGQPADNNAFLVLDITGVKPATYKVTVVDETTPSSDATLSDLKIGSLSLTPAFASGTITYTAATTNASNTVNAIPSHAGTSIQVLVNDTEIDNGTAATWQTGSNTLKVKTLAEDGVATKTYTVTVTKSAGV